MSETVQLQQQQDYRFEIRFGPGGVPLLADEPAPLGTGAGPSPVQLLAAAVGNCLTASFNFACAKYKQDPAPLRCEVSAEVGRNADKRMRVLGLSARLTLGVAGDAIEHLDRVLASFEDYCTVTASVRTAVPVEVQVFDAQGARLK